MPAVAGKKALVKIPSAAVTLTNEATTAAGDGKTYQITDASKRVLDGFAAITVKVGGSVTGETYTLNRITGTVVFATANFARAAVTISGSYLPLSIAAEAKSYSYNLTAKNDPDNSFGDDYVTRVQVQRDVRGSLGRWYIDTYFSAALLSDTLLVFQFFSNLSSNPDFTCWGRLSRRGLQLVQAGLVEELLDFDGVLDADNHPHDLIPATTSTVVVSDTFTRADSASSLGTADTGQAWTAGSGTWGITSNQAYCPTPGGDAVAVVESTFADVTVTGTIVTAAADNGLVLRYSDVNNYIRLIFESGNWFLQKKVAGGITTITSVAGSNSNGDIIALIGSGSTIMATKGGVSLFTPQTDAFNQTATKHGLTAASATSVFDNFTITH